MKMLAAVAVMLGLLAIPAVAQHGGAAHAGSGGHAASGGFAAHGGFGGSGFSAHSFGGGIAPRAGSFAPRYGGNFRPQGFAAGRYAGPNRTGYGSGIYRQPYRANDYARGNNGWGREGDHHHRMPYNRGFNGYVYPYNYGAYLAYPYDLDPWLFGPDWSDSDDYDNSAQAQSGGYLAAPYPNYGEPGPEYGEQAPQGYAPQPYPQQEQPQWAPDSSSRQSYPSGPVTSPGPQKTLMVIFKDGRPPVQIHNFILTASTLTVLDGQYLQKIPVDQIDVAATESANSAAGLAFQVPGS